MDMSALRLLVVICLFVSLLSAETRARSSKSHKRLKRSVFTPKNLHKTVEVILPLFVASKPEGESRKGKAAIDNAIENVRQTLETSAKANDGWMNFGKRLASVFLTGSTQIKDGKLFDKSLATKLYEKSPQFIKDSIQVHLDGSLVPTLEKKVKEIIQTIKEKNNTMIEAENKQLTPFDPLVFGANAMLNLMYFSAFNIGMMSNMGLDNLFNPDYDYDYDALNEEEEEEAVEGEGEGEGGEGEGEGEEQQNGAPQQTRQQNGATQQNGAQQQNVRQNGAPQQNVRQNGAPQQNVRQNGAPQQNVRQNGAPQQNFGQNVRQNGAQQAGGQQATRVQQTGEQPSSGEPIFGIFDQSSYSHYPGQMTPFVVDNDRADGHYKPLYYRMKMFRPNKHG